MRRIIGTTARTAKPADSNRRFISCLVLYFICPCVLAIRAGFSVNKNMPEVDNSLCTLKELDSIVHYQRYEKTHPLQL